MSQSPWPEAHCGRLSSTLAYLHRFTRSHQGALVTCTQPGWCRVLHDSSAALSLGRSCSLGVCDPPQDKMKAGNMLVQSGPLPTPYMCTLSPAGSTATTPLCLLARPGAHGLILEMTVAQLLLSPRLGEESQGGMCGSVQRPLPTLFPRPARLSTLAGVPL